MTEPRKFKHKGRLDFYEEVPQPKKRQENPWPAIIGFGVFIFFVLTSCGG